jgi:hypothetical protein
LLLLKVSMKTSPGRNAKILGLAGFLAHASGGMIAPLLPLFLVKVLLAPASAIGLMEGLAGLAACIPGSLPWHRPGRVGNGKGLVLAGYSLSATVKGILVSASGWPQAAAIGVVAALGNNIAERPQEGMMALSGDGGPPGRAADFRNMLGSMGAAAGPLLAALALASIGSGIYAADAYRAVFMLAFALSALAVPALLLLQDKPVPQGRARMPLRAIFATPGLPQFLAFAAVLALGQFSAMFFVLRAADFLPFALIPVAYLAYAVFRSVFSLPAGILAARAGPRAAMGLGLASFLFALVGAAFFPSLTGLFLAFALLGVSMAVADSVPQALVPKIVPGNDAAPAMESYKSLAGLVSVPANLLAGLLWAVPLLGAPAPFLFSIAATLAAAVLLLLVVRD